MDTEDQQRIRAAEGWVALGDWQSANDELEEITPAHRAHPDVLFVRVTIYSLALKWDHAAEVARTLCRLLPDDPGGFVQLSIALYKLGRTQEAFDVLLPLADKFPNEPNVHYNLACYAAQLNQITKARRWLHQTFDAARIQNAEAFWKEYALHDPDLQPLLKAHGLD